MPEAPARNGATARMIPTNRPTRIAFGAMALEEAVDALEPLRRDADPRPAGIEERPSETAAEHEADQVAGGGRQPHEQEHRAELDVTLRGDDAAQHHGGLAGSDQADERARLQEREAGHERVGPRAERVGQVGQRGLEVRQLDRCRRSSARTRRPPGPRPRSAGPAGACGQSCRDLDGHFARPPGGARRSRGAGRTTCVGTATTSMTSTTSAASSWPHAVIVRRSAPSATRPIGAGSQIAIAR